MKRADSLKYDKLIKIQKDYQQRKSINYNIDEIDEMICQIELENKG